MENTIQIINIKPQLVEHFDNLGNSLGFLNEYESNEIRYQVMKFEIEGCYIIFNNIKTNILVNGDFEKWPSKLYTQSTDSLIKMIKVKKDREEQRVEKNRMKNNQFMEELGLKINEKVIYDSNFGYDLCILIGDGDYRLYNTFEVRMLTGKFQDKNMFFDKSKIKKYSLEENNRLAKKYNWNWEK